MGGTVNRFDAQATYGAAAQVYEDASRDYWRFSAERTVERLELRPGQRVLDVACGTGSSAIPAAVAVAPGGSVVAIDYAEPMLAIARQKAEARALDNIEWRVGDMTRLDLGGEQFDAVVCVLGIFFVEDMPALLASLWGHVRPGGRLAVTMLGPRVFTPVIDEWATVVSGRSGAQVRLPWQRTDDPKVVADLFRSVGIAGAQVDLEDNHLPLGDQTDVWKLVMGTGLRAATVELGDRGVEAVREHLRSWVRRNEIAHVDLDVIYATADKSEA